MCPLIAGPYSGLKWITPCAQPTGRSSARMVNPVLSHDGSGVGAAVLAAAEAAKKT